MSLEASTSVSTLFYKSVKKISQPDAVNLLKKQIKFTAKKVIDEMTEEEFDLIFDTKVEIADDKININVKLKHNG